MTMEVNYRQASRRLSRSLQQCMQQRSRTARTFSRSVSTQEKPESRLEEMEELPADFNIDNVSSLGHKELEVHREMRQMARIAAWEMPLLSSLSKPFVPPTAKEPLRWRYTTYMGESHPAANKVVVEFSVNDLPDLDVESRTVLKKLAGARWNPKTDLVKMSCESFQTQAQNKRYLGETIAKLIKEAKEGKDKFKDLPLDTRTIVPRLTWRDKPEYVNKFPKAWLITPKRRAELDAKHASSRQIEEPVQPAIEETRQPTEEEVFAAVTHAAIEAGELPGEPGRNQPAVNPDIRPLVDGLDAIQAHYRLKERQDAEQRERAMAASTAAREKASRATKGKW